MENRCDLQSCTLQPRRSSGRMSGLCEEARGSCWGAVALCSTAYCCADKGGSGFEDVCILGDAVAMI